MHHRSVVLVAAALLLAFPPAPVVRAAQGKCLHCLAVGAELQRRLDNERPRNHLDLRHRLDSQGNRYGKVIDYKVSELRAVELLDDLCDSMKQYDLVYLHGNETGLGGRTSWAWIKARGDDAMTVKSKFEVEKPEMKSRQLDLENYCGRVLDTQEEDLTRAITGGTLEKEVVTEYLCMRSLKVCKPEPKASAADASEKGESKGSAKEQAKEEL